MSGDGGWRWLLKMYIHTNIGYIYVGLNKGLIKGMAKSSNFFYFGWKINEVRNRVMSNCNYFRVFFQIILLA